MSGAIEGRRGFRPSIKIELVKIMLKIPMSNGDILFLKLNRFAKSAELNITTGSKRTSIT